MDVLVGEIADLADRVYSSIISIKVKVDAELAFSQTLDCSPPRRDHPRRAPPTSEPLPHFHGGVFPLPPCSRPGMRHLGVRAP